MFLKRSRYGNVRTFSRGENGKEVFPGIRPRQIKTPGGVIEHIVKQGDRLDLLAGYYYNNDRMWWRIADANPEFIFAGHMVDPDRAGDILIIPKLKG